MNTGPGITRSGPLVGMGALLVEIAEAAMEAARAEARRRSRARTRRDNARTRRNWALHPGTETPLWNELVRRVTPLLRPRGSKAQLARVLGVPRQRLQDCLRSKNAMLDAERTLLLLGWLEAAYRGRPPATPPPGVIEPELE